MNTIKIQKLQKALIFKKVEETTIKQLLAETPHAIREYNKKEFVAIQGDTCNRIFLLYQGSIQAQMTGSDGKKIIIEEIHQPCILAPAFIFATENKFPVTIETITLKTIIITFQRDNFIQVMQKQPLIMQNFIREISDRSILLAEKVKTFALQTLKVRFANYLYHHNHPATQQYISEYLGVARPSLNRVVGQFIEKGYIQIENRKIVVKNREKLKELTYNCQE